MEKPEDVEVLPLESVNPLVNLMVRDVATVKKGVRPGELDRDMSQRYLTLTANVEGEDMGRASRQVQAAIDAAGIPPQGVRVELMGQLPPMLAMFKALSIGLAVAVFVIVVLLTAYFQSPRLALISIGAVPGVLAGIAAILYFTNTSLNIESFMGSIMCLGVSVSNSVMLVTFMSDHWKGGSHAVEAAIVGAGERLRPILMTACAMTVGMVPMALALERGSQMQAPLGLAVIGGLVMSTFATLLVLPSVFAIVIGNRVAKSPSVYPDDPESVYYDPHVFDAGDKSGYGESGHEASEREANSGSGESTSESAQSGAHAGEHGPAKGDHAFDKVLAFPWDPLAVEGDPYVTHHNADELLGPLGFTAEDQHLQKEAPNDPSDRHAERNDLGKAGGDSQIGPTGEAREE